MQGFLDLQEQLAFKQEPAFTHQVVVWSAAQLWLMLLDEMQRRRHVTGLRLHLSCTVLEALLLLGGYYARGIKDKVKRADKARCVFMAAAPQGAERM